MIQANLPPLQQEQDGYPIETPRRKRRHEDDYEEEERKRIVSRRREEYDDENVGFRCPFCKTKARPIIRKEISTAGWVMLVVLLICCFPLFWIGLLIKRISESAVIAESA
jgi:hypothetical protein